MAMPNNGTQQTKSGTEAPRKKRGRPPKAKAEPLAVPIADVDVRLAKISGVRFGIDPKSGLYGLELSFSGDGWSVSAAGKYLDDIEATANVASSAKHVWGLLKLAKVAGVNELLGVPVEVTIINNAFGSFRVLTEVL